MISGYRTRFTAIGIGATLLSLGVARQAAWAADTAFVTGVVLSRTGKEPVAGATVAVYDQGGKVIDYAKTDTDGTYVLAVPWSALRIKKAAGGGFVRKVGSGVTRITGGIGRMASGPLKAGIRAAAAAASADPVLKIGAQAAAGLATSAIDTVGGSGKRGRSDLAPGAMWLRISATGREDLVSPAQLYWLEREEHRAGGKALEAYLAWLDPVMLAAGGEGASAVDSGLMRFSNVRVEPGIAEVGAEVTISARFPTPTEPRTPVRVVAKIERANILVPLEPAGGDRYQGKFVVGKRFPLNDMMVALLAYAQQEGETGPDPKVESTLARAGFFEADREYVFDPMRVVSRNRGQASLTVVRPPRR